MPYIKQDQRDDLDSAIELISEILSDLTVEKEDACGLLNYTITSIISSFIMKRFNGKLRYWIINMICGTLSNVNSEFYRRVAVPYEDKKIKENGDVNWKEWLEI